jgi:hypothetical protein
VPERCGAALEMGGVVFAVAALGDEDVLCPHADT